MKKKELEIGLWTKSMSFLPVDTLRGKTVAGEAKCRRNRTKTFDKLQNVQA